MDIDAEIREYQWRRKFEAGPRRTLHIVRIVAVVLLVAVVIARSIS